MGEVKSNKSGETISSQQQRQLTKQNGLIGEWIANDDERSVVLATTTNNHISKLDKEGKDKLIDILGAWRYYLGISREASPEELVILAMYIREHFGDLTLEEIELAKTTSFLGKLNVDVNHYGNFSVFYVNNILLAFKSYRNSTMTRVLDNRHGHLLLLEKENKRTPEYLMRQMKDVFSNEYNNYKNDGEMMDFFSVCYNFLRKTKRLIISQERVKEAMEYGRAKAISEMQNDSSIKNALMAFANDEENPVIKRYARNFCVQKYFDTIKDIQELLSSFKTDEFK